MVHPDDLPEERPEGKWRFGIKGHKKVICNYGLQSAEFSVSDSYEKPQKKRINPRIVILGFFG